MKKRNLAIFMIALLVGVNTLYANEVKAKKIIYSSNIVYEGEAIKLGKVWVPSGQGVLYFSISNIVMPYLNPSVSYFKIKGEFEDKRISSAVLSPVKSQENTSNAVMGQTNRTEISEDIIYEGTLSYVITSQGKMSYGDIALSFEKGVLFGGIEDFSPFSIEYGPQKYNSEVEFAAVLSNSINMDRFDPYGIKSGVNYTATANAKFLIGSKDFECSISVKKVVWKDGAVAEIKPVQQVTQGNRRWFDIEGVEDGFIIETDNRVSVAVYNEEEYIIYPIRLSDYAARSFQCRFRKILSDGTIIGGIHEDNTPHVRFVKCTDGRVFEGSGELGVVIKGGETMDSLFSSKSLTKENIKFINGSLYDAEGEEIDSFGNGIGYYGEFPHF